MCVFIQYCSFFALAIIVWLICLNIVPDTVYILTDIISFFFWSGIQTNKQKIRLWIGIGFRSSRICQNGQL